MTGPASASFCAACGARLTGWSVCEDCGALGSALLDAAESAHPTFVWQPCPGGDLELLRTNAAAVRFTHGKVARLIGERAGDIYASEPAVRRMLLEVAATRRVHVEFLRYRLRSVDEERDVEVVIRPGCGDLVMVTVLHPVDVEEELRVAVPPL